MSMGGGTGERHENPHPWSSEVLYSIRSSLQCDYRLFSSPDFVEQGGWGGGETGNGIGARVA